MTSAYPHSAFVKVIKHNYLTFFKILLIAPGASNFCVSGCIGRRVKLWSIDNYECVKQHNDHKAEITAVTTSMVAADLIVSGMHNVREKTYGSN